VTSSLNTSPHAHAHTLSLLALQRATLGLPPTLHFVQPGRTLISKNTTLDTRQPKLPDLASQQTPNITTPNHKEGLPLSARPQRASLPFLPPVWVPDAKTDACMRCARPFGLVRFTVPLSMSVSFSLPSFARIVVAVLLVILTPTISIGAGAGGWVAYGILIVLYLVYLTLFLILVITSRDHDSRGSGSKSSSSFNWSRRHRHSRTSRETPLRRPCQHQRLLISKATTLLLVIFLKLIIPLRRLQR
jgi:hypothetical protein